LSSFAEQIASGIAFVAAAFLVDNFAGIVVGQAQQSAQTIERIGLIYGIIPAVALALAGIIILWYPLDRRRMQEIQAHARERTAALPPVNTNPIAPDAITL
jgi:Na+/melibiose symporter-like transporter